MNKALCLSFIFLIFPLFSRDMSVPYMPTTEREAGDLSEEGCLGAQIKVLLLSLRCSLLRTVELLQDGVARRRELKLSLYQQNKGADRYKSMSGLDCQILCVDCLFPFFLLLYRRRSKKEKRRLLLL